MEGKIIMKSVTRRKYVCELAREINDLHQSDSEHDVEVRKLLSDIVHGAKAMVRKLEEYKEGTKLELFPEMTSNFKAKKKLRKQEGYKKIEI
jgi:hypothetical protein